MNFWNEIYMHFDPVTFSLFGFKVHWYGLMYVLALFTALWLGKYFAKKEEFGYEKSLLESYFIWVEIGVILGARLGYIFIYSGEATWFFTHPWEIFNPFYHGEFVGIRGMSYHGAVVGFIIATLLFCARAKISTLKMLDLVALSVPLGYFFGRIGNFLNQELFGRVTDVSWGILVDGVLRHPSQIYEAILEGLAVFAILFFYSKFRDIKRRQSGELIGLYAILYSVARYVCENWREPDSNLGFVFLNFSMGQILSFIMFVAGNLLYLSCFFKKNSAKN